MASNIIPGSDESASVPTLGDILMSLTDVKGAVACALGKIEHDNSDATGTLTIALSEMERTSEQIEELQRQVRSAVSGTDAATPADVTDAVPQPVRTRIATLRDRMFAPMAAIDVASQAIDIETDCNMHRLLVDAYKQLDAIALEMWQIGGEETEEHGETAEVAHG